MNDASVTWRSLPLADGARALIEASAGTGKTWTIAALYLRLHLQQRLLPPQIVVTTFTSAAAQELRERLRARLLRALARADAADARADAADSDDVDVWMDECWHADPSQRAADALHLRLALAEFDRAPITTLHGLCGKIIAEHGLMIGADFSADTMTSGNGLDAQLRDDAWRRIVQAPPAQRSAGETAWAQAGYKKFTEALTRACEPGMDVRCIDLSALKALMTAKNAQVLRDGANSIRHQSKKRTLKDRLSNLADYLLAGDVNVLPKICTDKKQTLDILLRDQVPPETLAAVSQHPAIVLARAVLACVPKDPQAPILAQTLAEARQWLLGERERRLRARSELSFDAMIARVADALAGDGGAELAVCVRQRWPIALVDEFQDTDARQFDILDHLWPQATTGDATADACTRRLSLVMIGDPKQAIYAFRGGDIAAYQRAGATARTHMRLDVNRRSTPEFVAACNELFDAPDSALGRDGKDAIRYIPARACAAKDGDRTLTIDGQPCARPLAIHQRRSSEDKKEGAEYLRDQALDACARHIATMLQERRHRIGGELLAPGDLAVLLPANRDIAALRTRLTACGVPSVGAGTQSVFASDSARDLQVIFYAIAHPHDVMALRAALATPLFFDRDFAAIRALADDADGWQRIVLQFAGWHQQWQRDGVQAVLASLIASQAAPLGGRADSERRLTDLRHLGELLQARARDGDGVQGLLTWLAEQRAGDSDDEAGDERQLRVESDARRVRLMTLHACKGLQFPVVFLPLLWAHKGKSIPFPLARANDGKRRLLDLGGPEYDATLEAAQWESQDERFRVLYVALTRAQYACHVYALDRDVVKNEHERSALQVQLSRLRSRAGENPLERTCPHVDWSEDWPETSISYQPDAAASPALRAARPLVPAPRPFLGRYSFSSLVHRTAEPGDNGGASDEPAGTNQIIDASEEITSTHPQLIELERWKGTEFGTALHSVFEKKSPGASLSSQHALVQRCLHDNGIDFAHDPHLPALVATRLQAVLDAPLHLADGAALRLRDLRPAQQRHEMAFCFALDGAQMKRLREVCKDHGQSDVLPEQAPATLRGTMSGFIDLVFEHEGRFHVLDWKSNWLGARLDDYAPTALRGAMDHHHYRFQALLYTIALDRYLRSRLPDYDRSRQLGAAVYLFVRAVGLSADAGVWSQRFSDAFVAAADAALAHGEAGVMA